MIMKTEILTGVLLESEPDLSLDELSHACRVHAELIEQLVEEGIIDPIQNEYGQRAFSGNSLMRARSAIHLQRDLGVNLSGAALILDLLDEIENLRGRLRVIGHEC